MRVSVQRIVARGWTAPLVSGVRRVSRRRTLRQRHARTRFAAQLQVRRHRY